MNDQPNYQRIAQHLQIQRNQLADAHAVAAARGDALAEELQGAYARITELEGKLAEATDAGAKKPVKAKK